MPVKSTCTGHGFAAGRPTLYHDHGVIVAQGPAIMVTGEQLTVQVMDVGTTPLRLTTDMTVGYIDLYEAPTCEVSPNELKELDGTTQKDKESPLPGVDLSSEPDKWSGAHKALLKKHAPFWGGNLGLMSCVERRIRINSGAVLVCKHPYKAGPLAREREKAEVQRMRLMGVVEPSTGEWSSPLVKVPKLDGSVRFCID